MRPPRHATHAKLSVRHTLLVGLLLAACQAEPADTTQPASENFTQSFDRTVEFICQCEWATSSELPYMPDLVFESKTACDNLLPSSPDERSCITDLAAGHDAAFNCFADAFDEAHDCIVSLPCGYIPRTKCFETLMATDCPALPDEVWACLSS